MATAPGQISDEELLAQTERQRQRRADIDFKQSLVAEILTKSASEGLLVLRPENVAWLTGGSMAFGANDPAEAPALYFSPENRWLLSANVDTQRLFDFELDGLGFQLKEWPWHWGRSQCLADLCEGKVVACDIPYRDARLVGDSILRHRLNLTPYEQACLRALGQVVGHALEATCRTLVTNLSEREIAGQVGHRLLHRGVVPVSISVAGDDRARTYRHYGFTDLPVRKLCTIKVTGCKYGLHATAARAICFGQPDDALRQEFDTVSKVTATYVYGTRPSAVPGELIQSGRRVYQQSGYDYEWLSGPQGEITGRLPIEVTLRPTTEELLQAGWAVTWQATAGAALSCDTFLITEQGAECVTPMEAWPMKRLRYQGEELARPYMLVR
jgi:Xaa-Pro aminopeptidase